MACLAGANIQTQSLGLADGVLTAKPKITFWRHVIKQYTNFALEAHDLDFNSGSAQFGASPSCQLDRIGDLVYWTYVVADLPAIGLSDGAAIRDNSEEDSSNGATFEPYWTHAVGQALVEKASFYIAGQCVDEILCEMAYVWEELSGAPGKRLIEMTGKYDAIAALQVISRVPRRLYIPLYFWFTLNSGLALPLVSLNFHSVKIQVKFRGFLDLLKITEGTQDDKNHTLADVQERAPHTAASWDKDNEVVNDISKLSALSNSSLSAKIMVTYVYLSQAERTKFAEGAFETVMAQHQYVQQSVDQTISSVYGIGSDKTVRNDLTFNHTVMELFWVVRMQNHESFVATTPATNMYNEWFNFGGPADLVTELPIDPIVKCRLLLNNSNRWEEREGRYFRLVQPFQHHTNVPDKFIYCYSFAAQPQDIQPSGTCNFSRIDSTVLELTLDGRLFYGPSSASNTDGNSACTVLIFARNWNVLRFKYGLGGVRFL